MKKRAPGKPWCKYCGEILASNFKCDNSKCIKMEKAREKIVNAQRQGKLDL